MTNTDEMIVLKILEPIINEKVEEKFNYDVRKKIEETVKKETEDLRQDTENAREIINIFNEAINIIKESTYDEGYCDCCEEYELPCWNRLEKLEEFRKWVLKFSNDQYLFNHIQACENSMVQFQKCLKNIKVVKL